MASLRNSPLPLSLRVRCTWGRKPRSMCTASAHRMDALSGKRARMKVAKLVRCLSLAFPQASSPHDGVGSACSASPRWLAPLLKPSRPLPALILATVRNRSSCRSFKAATGTFMGPPVMVGPTCGARYSKSATAGELTTSLLFQRGHRAIRSSFPFAGLILAH